MKLHIGSGSVYLEGWINVDLPAPNTFLASERPDLVDRWKTTDGAYYARHADKTIDVLRAGPLDQEYVCDRYGSFHFLPVPDGEVDIALSRHVFEHLSSCEAHRALELLFRAVRRGGRLIIDVPDHVGTLELLMDTRDPFYVRHLLGPKRGEHGVHMQSYSVEGLRSLVESNGFEFVRTMPNIHIYPAICVEFVRS